MCLGRSGPPQPAATPRECAMSTACECCLSFDVKLLWRLRKDWPRSCTSTPRIARLCESQAGAAQVLRPEEVLNASAATEREDGLNGKGVDMSFTLGCPTPREGYTISAAAVGLGLLLGCSHQPEPRMTPASGVISEPERPATQQAAERNSGYIQLSEGVRSRCNLPDAPTESPQFDFDASVLRDRGMGILDGVASCMLRGSLKDEVLTIVGHADPRGSEEYNQGLGLRRAESARDYLMRQGVPLARIIVRSRGEQEAQGTGPDSWQLDRRVEIEETTPASSSP